MNHCIERARTMNNSQESIPPPQLNQGWLRALDSSKPTYACPKCGEQALQFYAVVPWNQELEERFACCACGSNWHMN